MNRYKVAGLVIHFVVGAAVGTLAKQAGYSFWAGCLWVVGLVALSTLYGAVEVSRHFYAEHRKIP